MTLLEQLEHKNAEIEKLSDELPSELSRKINLIAETLGIIGKLHEAATNDYGRAYAKRKASWGNAIVKTEGTQAVKEGSAEIASYQYRLAEAKYESEMIGWKNAFVFTQELLQAKKLALRQLMHELNHQE